MQIISNYFYNLLIIPEEEIERQWGPSLQYSIVDKDTHPDSCFVCEDNNTEGPLLAHKHFDHPEQEPLLDTIHKKCLIRSFLEDIQQNPAAKPRCPACRCPVNPEKIYPLKTPSSQKKTISQLFQKKFYIFVKMTTYETCFFGIVQLENHAAYLGLFMILQAVVTSANFFTVFIGMNSFASICPLLIRLSFNLCIPYYLGTMANTTLTFLLHRLAKRCIPNYHFTPFAKKLGYVALLILGNMAFFHLISTPLFTLPIERLASASTIPQEISTHLFKSHLKIGGFVLGSLLSLKDFQKNEILSRMNQLI